MLRCTVKFCGGCNPRYDRGAVYDAIRSALTDFASFSLPQEGDTYDLLLIIRGCTGCSYLYEDISAKHRVILEDARDQSAIISSIRSFAKLNTEGDTYEESIDHHC